MRDALITAGDVGGYREGVQEQTVERTRGRVSPSGWWFDGALVGGVVALTGALAAGWFLDLDTAVSDWVSSHQPDPVYWLARALNFLGNGGPLTLLCLAIAVVLGIRRRSVWPAAPVVAAFLVTGFAIMPLKLWTDREAPRSTLADKVELFNVGDGLSYPSGHMVNVVVWYGVLALLLAPWLGRTARRWLRIAPPVIVFCTTVYLDFHWVTDSVAGLLLGVLLDRLLARIPWRATKPESGLGTVAGRHGS